MALTDTTFLIDLLNDHAGASHKLEAMIEIGEPIWIPTITLHELYYGAGLHERADRETDRVRELERALLPVAFTAEAARIAGRLESQMEADGVRPGRADIQIASMAIERGEALVTADGGFDAIEELRTETY